MHLAVSNTSIALRFSRLISRQRLCNSNSRLFSQPPVLQARLSSFHRHFSATAMSGPITQIVRFVTSSGAIHIGEPIAGSSQASILSGSIFTPLSLQRTGEKADIARYLPPIEHIAALECIGLNYLDHQKESDLDLPAAPMLFFKNPASEPQLTTLPSWLLLHCALSLTMQRAVSLSTVLLSAMRRASSFRKRVRHSRRLTTRPRSTLTQSCSPAQLSPRRRTDAMPVLCLLCLQLAVVIGRPCKDVSEADALSYVLGYLPANDVSNRTQQFDRPRSGGQFCRAKGFDTYCPLGPHLTLAAAVPDPQSLTVRTLLNGKVMQDGNTAQMIFSVRRIISYLSEATTLLPGTVILTGTPAGCGWKRSPPVFLLDGDTVEVKIQGLGTLRNKVQFAK